jgi:hypothetical protein
VDGGEPIEIELTPVDAPAASGGRAWRRTRTSGRSEDPQLDQDQDEGGGGGGGDWLTSDHGKLVTTGAVVGVIALLLGWMLGRSGGRDDLTAGVDDAPTSVAEPSTTAPLVGDPVEPADFAEAEEEPAATRPTRATTTVPSGPTTEPIDIDPRLRGIPLRLVVVGFDGTPVEIDLERGLHTDYHARSRSWEGSAVAAGDDWILMSGGDSSGGTVIWSDGSTSTIDGGGYWRLLPVEGIDRVWRMTDQFEQAPRFQLVGVDGDVVEGDIELPPNAWPLATDPASGGLIAQVNGRAYSVLPGETTYLGFGSLIAVSVDQVLLGDCDEQLVCGLRVVDRATGDTRVVPGGDAASGSWQSIYSWGTTTAGFSPDGRWATVIGGGWNQNEFGIIDVDTGEFVALALDAYPPIAIWTPDARFVIYLDSSHQLTARDLETGEEFDVLADTLPWTGLTARPTSVAADDSVEG